MKQSLFSRNIFLSLPILLVIIFATACVKDRTFSSVTPPAQDSNSTNEVIHYWNFNGSSLLTPTLTLFSGSIATSDTYDETDGTLLNTRDSSEAGNCLRMRNPSTNMVINAPTTEHDSIKVSFAVMRTNNGPQANTIEYSTDGTTFINTGLTPTQIVVGEDWQVFYFDFSAINGASNNPNFKVRITFTNGNTNASGNDRYDNLVVEGTKL